MKMRSNKDLMANYTAIPGPGFWLWLGGWTLDGYGKVTRSGKYIDMAHRMFYRAHVGEIPAGMFVCHKCDTPPCINPAHLFLGTHAENVMDMWTKGRARPRGVPAQLRATQP
jgi:hypothetical protein